MTQFSSGSVRLDDCKSFIKGLVWLIMLASFICFFISNQLSAQDCTADHIYSIYPYPGNTEFYGMWGASDNDIFLLGSNTQKTGGLIMHYNGQQWDLTTLDGLFFKSIWGSRSDRVFAVGLNGTIVFFDGAQWTNMNSGTQTNLNGVWCDNNDFAVAVGESGTILTYDGKNWTTVNSNTTEDFKSVWGRSSTDIYAVGKTIVHYDGHTWQPVSVPGAGQEWFGVTGSSATLYIASYDKIIFYDGTTWHKTPKIMEEYIAGLWCNSATEVYAVTTNNTLYKFDGAIWQKVSTESRSDRSPVTSFWISNTGMFYVARDNAGLLKYNGKTWSSLFFSYEQPPLKLGGYSDGSLYFGINQSIVTYDGQNWSQSDIKARDLSIDAVWSDTYGKYYMVGGSGGSGMVVYHDQTGNQVLYESKNAYLDGIWGLSPNDIFVVGKDLILHYDGKDNDGKDGATGWTQMQVETTDSIFVKDVWGSSEKDVYAVDDNGFILHYDGNPDLKWTVQYKSDDIHFTGIGGVFADEVYAIGYKIDSQWQHETVIMSFDGSKWNESPNYDLPDNLGYGDIWATDNQKLPVNDNYKLPLTTITNAQIF